MTMLRRIALLAAPTVLALAPAAASAQAAKAPPPDRATLERAAFNLRLMLSAMQSDKIPAPVKDTLFSCVYSNSLGKISEAMEKAIANSKGKVNRTNPDQMIAVMAGVCGFRPQPPAAAPKR